MKEIRKIEVYNEEKDSWTEIEFKDLKKGNLFEIIDYGYINDELIAMCSGRVFVAISDAYMDEECGIYTIEIEGNDSICM